MMSYPVGTGTPPSNGISLNTTVKCIFWLKEHYKYLLEN
jgi:hypothetical protein